MKQFKVLGVIISFLVLIAILTGYIGAAAFSQEDVQEKTILMVIAPKGFRDEELFEPKRIFEEKGAKVKIASTKEEVAQGMLGGRVKPDLKISEVSIGEYDAIVIVGGIGSKEYLWEDKELRSLVKEAFDEDKIVSAICLSPVVLARAKVLKDKKATVFPALEAINELKKNGAIYIDDEVVVSDNIVTARGPEAAKEFALKIWKLLEGMRVYTYKNLIFSSFPMMVVFIF